MDVSVLVTYASKHGSTAQIAERIGQVLESSGATATVSPVGEVGSVATYGAVVVGSAVYVGRWRKEAVRFLESNARELRNRPVWLFSSGPTGEGDPVELSQEWTLPAKLQDVVDRIRPRDVALFHGALDVEELNAVERTVVRAVEAPVGDFRDWDAIVAWAEAIVVDLGGGKPDAAE